MAKPNYPNKSVKSKKSKSALETALNFIAFRARSEKEVRDRLSKKFTEEEVNQAIKRLNDWKFLNDEEFAKLYVESRSRSKPRSQYLLKLELKRLGINFEVESDVSDFELAKQALLKKKTIKSQDQAIRFLKSRGFSWEVIEKTVRVQYNERDVS